MNEYIKQQNEKYNKLMKKKIDAEESLNTKISSLEAEVVKLKKQLEDEVKGQRMSSEQLIEQLKKDY